MREKRQKIEEPSDVDMIYLELWDRLPALKLGWYRVGAVGIGRGVRPIRLQHCARRVEAARQRRHGEHARQLIIGQRAIV